MSLPNKTHLRLWFACLLSLTTLQTNAAIDSDSDGIADAIEGTSDSDGDGVPDYLDLDSDNDSISDLSETAQDTDSDGIPNYLDLDSNGNGALDYYESKITDLISYSNYVALDEDGNGVVDITNSFGSNGLADDLERPVESGQRTFNLADTDQDGVHDYLDMDNDNDGISNVQELAFGSGSNSGIVQGYKDLDSDDDAIFDVVEVYGIDADSDRDGKLDIFIDNNGDGMSDELPELDGPVPDTDGDGIVDAYDPDSDGDGISDDFENYGYDVFAGGYIISYSFSGVAPQTWSLPNELKDTDDDGTPDFRDLDSNNNGLNDLFEAGAVDADRDGKADERVLNADIPDSDADGIADFQEYVIPVIITVEDTNPQPNTGDSENTGEISALAAATPKNSGGGCTLENKSQPDLMMGLILILLVLTKGVRIRR